MNKKYLVVTYWAEDEPPATLSIILLDHDQSEKQKDGTFFAHYEFDTITEVFSHITDCMHEVIYLEKELVDTFQEAQKKLVEFIFGG